MACVGLFVESMAISEVFVINIVIHISLIKIGDQYV